MSPPHRIARLARRAGIAAVVVAVLSVGTATGLGEAGFDAPVITGFASRVAPCDESDFGCIDVSWTARDPGSSQLLYDLVVEHSGGRVTYAGEGSFRPGQRLRASLVPRSRPLCGTYLLTLTVSNDAQILTSRIRSLTRRANCVATDIRRK